MEFYLLNFFFQAYLPVGDEIVFENTKLAFSALSNSNSSIKDPLALLSESNPKLLLQILSLDGQDLSGCLANCSNRGVCGMDDNNKFGCTCQEFFRGKLFNYIQKNDF